MKILVTGSNGYLASHLIPALLERGISILGTLHTKTERLKEYKNIDYEVCDISNLGQTEYLLDKYKIDTIIHTAANISKSNDDDYMDACLNDIQGSANLLRFHKKIIFCSSISVYGRSGKFKETDVNPQNLYGWSKFTQEELLRLKGNGVSLRFAGIHGGRQSGVIYMMVRATLKKEPIILDEPYSRFRFLFVDDAVQAILLALEEGEGSYNVAGEEIVYLHDLAELIFDIVGHKTEIIATSEDYRDQILNIDKIKTLGYKPKSLVENITKMVEEMR